MSYIIVGLGNPGEQYQLTRHNTGRIILEQFRLAQKLSDWKEDIKSKSITSKGKIGKESVLLLEPETFMNKSGQSLASLISSAKKAEKLVVIHDDLDLPIGRFKVSFNKSSGGHRGVESIIKAIKTQAFIRLRIGISPVTASGKIKKPQSGEAVNDFILDAFKPKEMELIKKMSKKTNLALELIITESKEKAMEEANKQ